MVATARRPLRILKLFDEDARRRLTVARFQRKLATRVGDRWSDSIGGRSSRIYSDYETYLAHQRAKLSTLNLSEYNKKFRAGLRDRLPDCSGLSVICLAAREGAECLAFRDRGAFVVGIDLNPGADNMLVLPGDFHALQFADECVDRVFTNSLDHVFDLKAVCAEIDRVLKPGGLFIAEIARGSEEGGNPGPFEAHYWARTDDLIDSISKCGFKLASKKPIDTPWRNGGVQACFSRA